MPIWMFLLDSLLALGAALRLTRFIVADDVPGNWWVKLPLAKVFSGREAYEDETDRTPPRHPVLARYWTGLNCPHCVSVWFSAFVVVTLMLAGGPGEAADWWRIPAGFLTLAWLTGHIAAWSGDTDD